MKIVDFFKRIFGKKDNKQLLNAPKTQYQELVESIGDLELCKMFVERTTRNVTPEIERKIQDICWLKYIQHILINLIKSKEK